MNKKGFTLIELLAVIVILAVIALIVTPIVTEIIKQSKNSSDLRSVEGYLSAANNFYSSSLLDENKKNLLNNSNVCSELELSSEKADSCEVYVSEIGEVAFAIKLNDKCYKKTGDQLSKDITVSDDEDCVIVPYTDESCFGTIPRMLLKAHTNDAAGLAACSELIINKFGGTTEEANTYCQSDEFIEKLNYSDFFSEQDIELLMSDSSNNYLYEEQDGVSIDYYSCGREELIEINNNSNKYEIKYLQKSTNYNTKKLDSQEILDVKIPSKIGTYEVKQIEPYAFHSKSINSVVLPDTIDKIGSDAFRYNHISQLVLPNSVKYIGSDGFASNDIQYLKLSNNLKEVNCSVFQYNSLVNLHIPSGVEYISLNAFNRNNLEKVIMDSVKRIGENSFSNNYISSLTFSNNIEEIGYGAFDINSLTSVFIPSSIRIINQFAFTNNPNLTSIHIDRPSGSVFYGASASVEVTWSD